MKCARREAGAHRPAPSASTRSPASRQAPPRDRSRPDPSPGRSRARFFFLLPVLALLLGVPSLFAAVPAEAQTLTPPGVPQQVEVLPGNGQLTMSWSLSSTWGTASTEVFRNRHEHLPPRPEALGEGRFTPDRESVVAFPALLGGGPPDEERRAREEAARVSAMHARGGTGRGEIVGTIESGANPGHPDLAGQFVHVCAMGDCDDGRPGLDRPDASPRLDTDGHGTLVNGIVAAKRNGIGVYGVAHEARIASFGNTHTVVYPWGNACPFGVGCPPGVSDREDRWGPVFDEQIARGVDWMRSLGVGAVNNSWSRTWPWARERGVTADTIRGIMPETLPAFERYVAGGGVVVWAGGNGQSFHPAEEAVLPRYFPHLEKGWLAVVGVDVDGRISRASWRCGVAAEWCVAAPMVLVTTERNGRWDVAGGTSIAAPYVTASLAALKSMFPNLSYQEVRARILATANRSGRYADASTYGRGLLDLDAASRPVGGPLPPAVSLSAAPNPVTEGSPVTVTARMSRALADGVTIPLSVTRDTSEAGDHGTLSSIAIAGGATIGTGTVTTARDADPDDETFTVALGTLPSRVAAGSPSSVEVTIRDDAGETAPALWLLTAASDAQQGFVRVVNESDRAGTVRVRAFDDAGTEYGPVTLAIEAGAVRHFNSADLETGNPAKGLSGATGAPRGPAGTRRWRLVFESDLGLRVMGYLRTADGFLTSMNETVAETQSEDGYRYEAVFFNPASNPRQESRLRLVNRSDADATVTVTGLDDAGEAGEEAVGLTLPAGAARMLDARALESGGDDFEGALGDGRGKWRLQVTSDQPLAVMSLLASPAGHLTNLSTAPPASR